jgi:hypothetical protein
VYLAEDLYHVPPPEDLLGPYTPIPARTYLAEDLIALRVSEGDLHLVDALPGEGDLPDEQLGRALYHRLDRQPLLALYRQGAATVEQRARHGLKPQHNSQGMMMIYADDKLMLIMITI